jgi:hypothetical protein
MIASRYIATYGMPLSATLSGLNPLEPEPEISLYECEGA